MKRWAMLLGGLAGTAGALPVAQAIVPGQTGAFPTSGDWSGANWSWSTAGVYKWTSIWNSTEFIGSAVAVAPNYLLTAGHVQGETTDYTMINGVRYSAVASYTPPPDAGQSVAPDLRLIKLDKTLPNYNPIFTGTISSGMNTFLLGYGDSGTLNGDSATWDAATKGTGRWGTNTVASSDYRVNGFGYSSMVFPIYSFDTDTPYEALAADGDSGGGAFVKVGNQWQLAGIFSTAGSASASAVSVPRYADWIFSVTGVPEPGSLALLSAAGLLTLQRRRKV
jgi:hypothetical protein